ncbi:MAG: transposase [Myxococcales bacterium]|nr:IS3 family transposase [Deltaproteobacteria bacterium]MBT8480912.1 IS3 family transposase [Deltaproteobacteria bacterium]NND28860.1 transposase [Myxococcales bacterium]NNL23779.1 transposase [Myxococcales bacterium]
MRYSFIHAEKAEHSVGVLCDALGVSRSGYYDWVGRGPSERDKANRALSVRIKAVHEASRCTYGSPRIQMELHEQGIRPGVNRIARLMHEMGLVATAAAQWLRLR